MESFLWTCWVDLFQVLSNWWGGSSLSFDYTVRLSYFYISPSMQSILLINRWNSPMSQLEIFPIHLGGFIQDTALVDLQLLLDLYLAESFRLSSSMLPNFQTYWIVWFRHNWWIQEENLPRLSWWSAEFEIDIVFQDNPRHHLKP